MVTLLFAVMLLIGLKMAFSGLPLVGSGGELWGRVVCVGVYCSPSLYKRDPQRIRCTLAPPLRLLGARNITCAKYRASVYPCGRVYIRQTCVRVSSRTHPRGSCGCVSGARARGSCIYIIPTENISQQFLRTPRSKKENPPLFTEGLVVIRC